MAREASSTVRGAPPAAPASSSTGSADSYDWEDARCFLYQQNEASDCLEAIEGETSAARVMLAAADAKVGITVFFQNKIPLF